jgi:hypothetical protein
MSEMGVQQNSADPALYVRLPLKAVIGLAHWYNMVPMACTVREMRATDRTAWAAKSRRGTMRMAATLAFFEHLGEAAVQAAGIRCSADKKRPNFARRPAFQELPAMGSS